MYRKPENSRQVLEDFVTKAETSEPMTNYNELQAIVSPEVVSALADVILKNGRPPNYKNSRSLAVLESRTGRKLVKGSVDTYQDDETPITLYLAEYKRGFMRFKRRSWVVLGIDGVGNGSSVYDGEDFYMPSLHSDETIKFYRDELGERGSPKNGLELAGEAIRERPRALNSFLEVTAKITKDLVKVVPAH